MNHSLILQHHNATLLMTSHRMHTASGERAILLQNIFKLVGYFCAETEVCIIPKTVTQFIVFF